MSQQWLAVLQIAVPAVLAVLTKFTIVLSKDRRARHRIRENAELLEALPEEYREHLGAVLDVQVRRYSESQLRQVRRKLDVSTIIVAIFVAAVGGAMVWVGFAVGKWWSILPGTVLGVAVLLFAAIGGIGNLYADEKQENATTNSAEVTR